MGKYIQEVKIHLTKHASSRMDKRSIDKWQVDQVLAYGRICHNRKAIIYAVGRKEVREYGRFLESCEGVHVICSSGSKVVMTTYRNHDFRGLRC